jgi:acetate---CoA ligase (ADP-forming)
VAPGKERYGEAGETTVNMALDNAEADVVLADGSIARVRQAGQGDDALIAEFARGLSSKSLRLRFGAQADEVSAGELMKPAPGGRTLVAMREGSIIGLASYVDMGTRADAGVVVADAYQGKGLGTILLGQLAQLANSEGVRVFQTRVSPDNTAMVRVLNDLGFPTSTRIEPGALIVEFPTSVERGTLEAFEKRESQGVTAAMEQFFRPRAVAVIGASRDRDAIGGRLFHNILQGGFEGPVYPVNPKSEVVQSVRAYKTVLECPDPVDLAMVVVPAQFVIPVAKECAQKGVKALVVISAGFSEIGGAGSALQGELVEVCRESGMRLVGPNCMGIVNTEPAVQLDAQFSPFRPKAGRIGFLSQSGALGIAVIEHANALSLGMSTFVSVGNKADISGNDLLTYWETDKNTDLILLYLESFGNPRKFARIARRVSRKKPILAVKSGRSAAGFRATQSHTGALLASSDVTVNALFNQAGVIRMDTLGEMFDVAAFLTTQPVPKGKRVAVITNAGGAGILAADACEDMGLKVPELSPAVQTELRKHLNADAGVKNPVDMIASATAEDFGRVIRSISKDADIDALMVLFVPPIAIKSEDVAKEIVSAVRDIGGRKPVLATFMAHHGISEILTDGEVRVPSYPFPEVAARALARAAEYGSWLNQPPGTRPVLGGIQKGEAAGIVARALARGPGWLRPEEADALLGSYGIPVVKTARVGSPSEAGDAAAKMGGKVVLKGIADGLLHKTESGAVRLGLEGSDQVEGAARAMADSLSRQGFKPAGFMIQEVAAAGVEMIVGVTGDPVFGPLVACGAGGTMVELLKDAAVRLAPLTVEDSGDMVRSLRTFPLLTGYRGGPAYDVTALEDVVLRVSAMVEDLPEITELDLNPVIVQTKGATVVDFRVKVEETAPPLPLGAKKR